MPFLTSKGLLSVLPGHIRVRVDDLEGQSALHRALYRFGCGYFTGKQKLARISPREIPLAVGVTVSTKGVIELCKDDTAFDGLNTHRELPIEVITLAPSHEELVSMVWGSTAWRVLQARNTKIEGSFQPSLKTTADAQLDTESGQKIERR